MGKRLIQQRRGNRKGRYKVPSHRYAGKIEYPAPSQAILKGEILDIINSVGHSSPLMFIEYQDGQICLLPASLGVKKGQQVLVGEDVPIETGNVVYLKNIPAGTTISNIEKQPFQNGKFMRASGTSAQVVGKTGNKVIVKLSSKKPVSFSGNCRATIGTVAGGGRTDKPWVKAGTKHHAMKARGKLYPRTSGIAMNAIDHPFGGTHSRRHKASSTRRGAPPGRKVGSIAPKRTGKKR